METTIQEIELYFKKLFPICRSITGNGNRETLNILKEIVPINLYEYTTDTKVYDWEIPQEWNVKSAWIKNSKGEKIVDFAFNNLHLVSYSIPVNKKISFVDLKKQLHYIPEQPDLIPYRTSYYNRNWGFCISYNKYLELFNEEEVYEVFIDSELKSGSLTVADYIIKGNTDNEYLFSAYCCHPSMANDSLSGLLLNAFLAKELSKKKLKNSYRFIFAPETIGAITYCATHEEAVRKIKGGYILTCLAGQGQYSYKHSFEGNHLIDKVVHQTFKEKQIDFISYPFVPQGSDERQYSSPGFRIPIGSVHKDKYHEYAYYHTSGDNLDFISYTAMLNTLEIYLSIIDKLENNHFVISLNPNCEPQLGKRGLYPAIGRRTLNTNKAHNDIVEYQDELDVILWILFYADGKNSLLDISDKCKLHFDQVVEIASRLEAKQLIKIIPGI